MNRGVPEGEIAYEPHKRVRWFFLIPWKAWRNVLWRMPYFIFEDRLTLVAGGVSFYLLLSIFPGLVALVSLYGLAFNPADLWGSLDVFSGIVPQSTIDLLGGELHRLAAQTTGGLTTSGAIAFAIALWSANSGTMALFDAMNVAYGEIEKRSLLSLYAIGFAFTIATLVGGILATAIVVGVPIVIALVELPLDATLVVSTLRWPVLLGSGIAIFSVVYRFGPCTRKAFGHWVLPGALFASAVWIAVSMLFSWYLANLGGYAFTYGSLAAIAGMMMWIYLSIIVVLFGAKLNAEIEMALDALPRPQAIAQGAG